ncbi:MAG: tRNA (cytidine(34)-2'-O)-methyltransferase [Alphaproteobacteria bacterium]|nr:MAG: tRNA (cytidine(34)-2'-O)-methyltransferase [Alphaproteobacteria bacterium]
MRIALYQPDMPPNTGTILRLGACMGVAIDIIEPCGFPFSLRALRRYGMDYLDHADIRRHLSWEAFLDHLEENHRGARLILLTTRAATPYTDLTYRPDDVLLLGQESAGVPDHVHQRADQRVCIPMAKGLRSLNVAVAAAMVCGEALRQTNQFPIKEGI